jgi:hypothetical protein
LKVRQGDDFDAEIVERRPALEPVSVVSRDAARKRLIERLDRRELSLGRISLREMIELGRRSGRGTLAEEFLERHEARYAAMKDESEA